MKTEYVFVYGPPASGKTLNSKVLQEALGCDAVVENYMGGDLPTGNFGKALVFLTSSQDVPCNNWDEPLGGVCSIDVAKKFLSDRWIEPIPGFPNPTTPEPEGWIADEIEDPAFTDLSGITETVDAIARLSDAIENVTAFIEGQMVWDARDEWVDPRPAITRLIHKITTAALEA